MTRWKAVKNRNIHYTFLLRWGLGGTLLFFDYRRSKGGRRDKLGGMDTCGGKWKDEK